MKVSVFILCLCSMLSIKSCNVIGFSPGIKGNREVVSKEIAMNDYSEIKLKISGDVFYEQKTGIAPYFRIETDENIVELLDIRVKDHALVIESKNGKNISPTTCRIYTNSPQLSSICIAGSGMIQTNNNLQSDRLAVKISGSGDAIINQLVCNNLKTDIDGSGNIEANQLDCEYLSVNISGSGDAILNGKTGSATISLAGSGDIQAHNLLVQEMKCKIAGSGDIEANVAQKLDISIAGSGNVTYTGNPAVTQSIAGSGNVIRQ